MGVFGSMTSEIFPVRTDRNLSVVFMLTLIQIGTHAEDDSSCVVLLFL